MEPLLLLALLLLGLSFLLHRSGRRSPAAPAPAPVHRISDPAVAHRVLVEEGADAFSNRPNMAFFVELAKRRGGQREHNISTVPYGRHWRALRCNITSETLHPSRLGHGNLAPLHRDAIQNLTATLSAGTAVDNLRDHLRAAVFAVVARLCFGNGTDERDLRAVCSAVHAIQVAVGEVKFLAGSSMLDRLAEWRYQRKLLAIHARITELCLPLIAARRRRSHDDDHLCRPYVDTLIQLRVPDGSKGGARRALSDDEIVDLVMEFVGAGSGGSSDFSQPGHTAS